MKKLLIYTLLLTHLCGGLAFAWDIHSEALTGHGSTAINLLINADHDHSDNELHHPDHSCHGAAHLVGLFFNPSTPFLARPHRDFFVSTPTPILRYIPPLLRPPIA